MLDCYKGKLREGFGATSVSAHCAFGKAGKYLVDIGEAFGGASPLSAGKKCWHAMKVLTLTDALILSVTFGAPAMVTVGSFIALGEEISYLEGVGVQANASHLSLRPPP